MAGDSFSEYYPELIKTLEEMGSEEVVASPNRDYEGSDFYYIIFNRARLDAPIGDEIRSALEIYLQLSSNTAADDASIIEYEIAAQRLAADIDHLKGQLRLAHAELRLAGATMQTQQVTIDYLLSGQVIGESLKNVTPKPKEEDKEELLSGTVALTKTIWKGIEFNLPEIFRRLRRLFKEGE